MNGILFSILFRKRMENTLCLVLKEFSHSDFSFKKLKSVDIESLHHLINEQDTGDLKYFQPHGFDLNSLNSQLKNSSFLMMGAFEEKKLIGYFFLRLFVNKKCFVGRLIDKQYRGLGIGEVMNSIMYETAWRMGFRCLSTISRNNTAIIRAHSKNQSMVVLKNLQNNYILVEFKRNSIVS
jgi:hypothetical protein